MGRSYFNIALVFFFCVAILSTELSYAEGIAVVVHPDNPIEQLSEREVKKIFLGRLGSFPGSNKSMEVLDQLHESTIYEHFYTKVIGFRLPKLRRYRAAYLFSGKGVLPTELSAQEAVKDHIERSRDAIGYIEQEAVDDTVKVVFSWPETDTQ